MALQAVAGAALSAAGVAGSMYGEKEASKAKTEIGYQRSPVAEFLAPTVATQAIEQYRGVADKNRINPIYAQSLEGMYKLPRELPSTLGLPGPARSGTENIPVLAGIISKSMFGNNISNVSGLMKNSFADSLKTISAWLQPMGQTMEQGFKPDYVTAGVEAADTISGGMLQKYKSNKSAELAKAENINDIIKKIGEGTAEEPRKTAPDIKTTG